MKDLLCFNTINECIRELIKNQGKVMVTIVGSGGKTTLLYRIAEQFYKTNRVLVTTTTAMKTPVIPWLQTCFLKEDVHYLSKDQNVNGYNNAIGLFDHRDSVADKVKGPEPVVLDHIYDENEFELILVEGDGSKGKPIKGYASYEPVIPEKTDLVLCVIGADGLGHYVSEDFIHRSALFLEQSEMNQAEPVDLFHVLKVMNSKDGPLSKVPQKAVTMIVINKMDDSLSFELIRQIQEVCRLPKKFGFDHVIGIEKNV